MSNLTTYHERAFVISAPIPLRCLDTSITSLPPSSTFHHPSSSITPDIMNIMVSQPQPDTELTIQIKALLNGFRRSKDQPKLSLEELSVAIITIHPELTLLELQRHILKAFKYYNDAAVEGSITRGYQGSWIISQFNSTFATLLRRFDLPFEVFQGKNEDDEDGDELFVGPAAAQIFLQKHLPSPAVDTNKGPFPFLKLPAELRLQIYGFCLGLPKSGVSVRQANRHSPAKEVVVRTKNFDEEMHLPDWETDTSPTGVRARWDNFAFRNRHDGSLTCPVLRTHLVSKANGEMKRMGCRWKPKWSCKALSWSTLLTSTLNFQALLRVNKEIFNEAMPVFYSINSFVCTDLFHLDIFLATLAPERREQLKHISFFYTKATYAKAAKAFKMLGEIEKLKRLDIMIDEEDFVGLTNSKGVRMFPDVLKLPGFHTLRSMRAVKTVQFHGECDTIRDALQSWVVDNEAKAAQPKKMKKKTTKPKKKKNRKAVKSAKRVAPVVVVVEEEEDEEDEEDEEEDSLFGVTTADSSEAGEDLTTEMEEAQDLFQETASASPFYSGYYSGAPSPEFGESTTTGTKLQSPFEFQSGSHMANRFQMQIPSADPTFARFKQNVAASETLTLPALQHAQVPNQVNTMMAPPVFFHHPISDVAVRLQIHGTGQAGEWMPEEGVEGVQRRNEMDPGSLFISNMEAASVATSYPEPGTYEMEDLLMDHDEYELLQ
ncbi:uncharacterized protein RCC_06808 [Ramularia collo-cygni]|uniref:Uncharacterized protein n=1 Tax=Ramularia collo-cygni TaxID=112498 RepID=A0A2D3V857_9PEZI|nr:uncharacterized protein RCC_06808 [Ramularia collo-cygni]CZT20947.1 uncharacterized protein RCC_06808 [Ramularia collo-cygni]